MNNLIRSFGRSRLTLLLLLGLGVAWRSWAAEGGEAAGSAPHIAEFLFYLVGILLVAKLGGEFFERMNQPAVLGELVFGVIIGNLGMVGLDWIDRVEIHHLLSGVAEVGVILLLFEVGLESDIDELVKVGGSAMLVAMLGVVAPMALGYGVSLLFLTDAAWYVHLFVAATLAATSVGITARVLKDMGKMNTSEARIILGAAVIDDVLGLIVLAVVTGLIGSIAAGGSGQVDAGQVVWITFKSVAFLGLAIFAGRLIAGRVLHFGSRFRVHGMPIVLSIAYCMLMAGLAETIGLAAIVGSFAAGLVLDETHYGGYEEMRSRRIEEILAPLSAVLVPVFFVLMGIQVDLASFGSLSVLQFAGVLSVAAIIGKQICSLGILEKGINRLAVGVGMIPRGEVGLIFASQGAALMVAGVPVFSAETFSAIVVMVMVTTLATPPLLKALFSKS